MSCKWIATDQPRIIPGRHTDTCATDTCKGCQPCHEPHCRLCGKIHDPHVCPGCMYDTRATLNAILTMTNALPSEAITKGVNSEAMNLLGPACDPEHRGHVEASILAGRLPAHWIETADGERHPLYVLTSWQEVYADAFDIDLTEQATVATAGAWLNLMLTRVAEEEWVPVEDFARDLNTCKAHLEQVLHDQPRGDIANVRCFECGGDLERRLTERDGFEDHWTCRRCHLRYTPAEYNFALRAAIEGESA